MFLGSNLNVSALETSMSLTHYQLDKVASLLLMVFGLHLSDSLHDDRHVVALALNGLATLHDSLPSQMLSVY